LALLSFKLPQPLPLLFLLLLLLLLLLFVREKEREKAEAGERKRLLQRALADKARNDAIEKEKKDLDVGPV